MQLFPSRGRPCRGQINSPNLIQHRAGLSGAVETLQEVFERCALFDHFCMRLHLLVPAIGMSLALLAKTLT